MSAARSDTPSSSSCSKVWAWAWRMMRSSRAATSVVSSLRQAANAAWKPGRRSFLPKGNVRVLRHQDPALRCDESPHACPLRLQPQAGLILLSRRDPVEPDRQRGGVERAAM